MKTKMMLVLVGALSAMLGAGCGTVRMGGEVWQGPSGVDGGMLTAAIGRECPCLPPPDARPEAPADPRNPPGTWVGRQLDEVADWAMAHPGWATGAGVAIVGIYLWGNGTDWKFRKGGSKGEPAPETTPASPADPKLLAELQVTGNNNHVEQTSEVDPASGKLTPIVSRVNVNGNNNTVVQTTKVVPPAEEEKK